MRMLLTPDQESTLWHFMSHVVLPDGKKYFHFPFYLQDHGNGEYERLTFQELPDAAKDMILEEKININD